MCMGQNQTIWLACLHSFQKGGLIIYTVFTIIYEVKLNPDVNKWPDVKQEKVAEEENSTSGGE